MARRKPQLLKHDDEPLATDEPEGTPGTRPEAGSGPANDPRISKTEAVRRALAAGARTPEEGVAFVRRNFGIAMSKLHFSSSKSLLKKKAGGQNGRPGRRPGLHEVLDRALASSPAPPPDPAGRGDLLDAMEALKPLVARWGTAKVKRLVDLLA